MKSSGGPRISLLGSFEVLIDDRRFDDRSLPPTAAAVVKLLALHPDHALGRDDVVTALWPDADAAAGRGRLYKALHRLRSATAPVELVSIDHSVVALAPDTCIDVERFLAAARSCSSTSIIDYETALGLYTDELLPDDAYTEWTLRQREELAARARDLFTELGFLHLDAGDFRRAMACAQEALTIDRCDERSHELLMLGYIDSGEPDLARSQYEQCRRTLLDQIGEPPSSRLIHLCDQLDGGAPGITADPEHLHAKPADHRSADRDDSPPTREGPPCPPIRHVHASDGVRIAYQCFGAGPVLVHLPQLIFNDLVAEWEIPKWRDWHTKLAEGRTYVRYDGRGTGRSQRDVDDLTVDALTRDLDAVVGELGLDAFDLYSSFHNPMLAISYAARHPDRVRRLVMCSLYANGSDIASLPVPSAGVAASQEDWELYCRSGASLSLGFDDEHAADLAEMFLTSSQPDYLRIAARDLLSTNVEDALPHVTMPVLVFHRVKSLFPTLETAQAVVDQLPDATLLLSEGTPFPPLATDADFFIDTIREFLGDEPIPRSHEVTAPSRC